VKAVIERDLSADGPTRDALAGGAKGFVTKPYDLRQVLEVVREVLDAGNRVFTGIGQPVDTMKGAPIVQPPSGIDESCPRLPRHACQAHQLRHQRGMLGL
jgi:hypothetical protein